MKTILLLLMLWSGVAGATQNIDIPGLGVTGASGVTGATGVNGGGGSTGATGAAVTGATGNVLGTLVQRGIVDGEFAAGTIMPQRINAGSGNSQSAWYSMVGGVNSVAAGTGNISWGDTNTTSKLYSVAFGAVNTVSGDYAIGLGGLQNTVNASYCGAGGNFARCQGTASFAFGSAVRADGAYNIALGQGAYSAFSGSFVAGDDQGGTITADSADQIKLRYQNGLKLVHGTGTPFSDGTTLFNVNSSGNGSFAGTVTAAGADMTSNKIVNVLNPTNPQDAATKNYVDAGSFANKALSNLTTTSINADFILNAPDTYSTGNYNLPWLRGTFDFLAAYDIQANDNRNSANLQIHTVNQGGRTGDISIYTGAGNPTGKITIQTGAGATRGAILLDGTSVLIGSGVSAATNAMVVYQDGHLKSVQTTAPTATVNANAGTGATCTVSNATDSAGKIALTTTAVAPAAGIQCDVNFQFTYAVAPICVLSAISGNSALFVAADGIYVTSTTAKLSVNFQNADAAGRAFNFSYHCIETQ